MRCRRRFARKDLLDRYGDDNELMGSIDANIDGDNRYQEIMRVYYHPSDDSATVECASLGPAGGRDYYGPGQSDFSVSYQDRLPPGVTAAQIIRSVKFGMGSTIKRYGKPTRNFAWVVDDDNEVAHGLSVNIVNTALSYSKGNFAERGASFSKRRSFMRRSFRSGKSRRGLLLNDLRNLAREYKQRLSEGETWRDLEDLEDEIKTVVTRYVNSTPDQRLWALEEVEEILLSEGINLEDLEYQ